MYYTICKFTDDQGKDYYLEWSNIADAPVTNGMDLESFIRYYRDEYGRREFEELPDIMARVEENGTSSHGTNLDDLIVRNRAGDNKEELTKKQIIEKYCKQVSDRQKP